MNNLDIRVEHFGSLLTATRKPILHDLSLFYALQKYFLKSSAIAPLAVSVESCYSYSFGEKKNSLAHAEWQPSGTVTTHARYAAGRRA